MNALLLADPSAALRLRALTELGGIPANDPEVRSLRAKGSSSPEVQRALRASNESAADLAYLLCRLAYLAYRGPAVADVAERLFQLQQADGSWPMWEDEAPSLTRKRAARPRMKPREEGWTMIPLQTSLPLRGLAAAGYATDPRTEQGYDWLLAQRLDDGTWPGDTKADLPVGGLIGGRTPGYRRLPNSPGCLSATTGAVACLALHPARRSSEETRAALDHLLARETRDEWTLGWEVSRLLGLERSSGRLTFYARFDLAFILDLATRCGASTRDARVADLVEFIEHLRGPYGLWVHPRHPQLSRWLTFDLDLSLRRLTEGDWAGSDLRVPYRPYPSRRPRY